MNGALPMMVTTETQINTESNYVFTTVTSDAALPVEEEEMPKVSH